MLAWLMEAWCRGLTRSPVKAEIAGSNPVASAVTHNLVGVDSNQTEEWAKVRPWQHRYGRPVCNRDLLEELPRELVPLVGRGYRPCVGDVRQERGQLLPDRVGSVIVGGQRAERTTITEYARRT